MTLHPRIAEIVRDLPAPPPGPLDPEAMRAGEEAEVPAVEQRTPVGSVEDITARTPVGEVGVRIYTPAGADERPRGLLVYFHGGAFFLGSLNTHDHVARSLTNATGFTVVSVDYRRAPENAYPAGLEDCHAVVRWATDHDETLRWNGESLAVAGDSSGGTFTAAVAAKEHDDAKAEGRASRITHQVLYYPSLDLDFDLDRYPSLRTEGEGYGLETAGLLAFNAFYLDSGAEPDDPLVSPIKRQDLSGLPPALIVTAEHDPLRDEGELYGQRLREAGVAVAISRCAGANHGFVQHFSWIPEYSGVFAETAAFLAES